MSWGHWRNSWRCSLPFGAGLPSGGGGFGSLPYKIMDKLVQATTYVLGDEKALALYEMNLKSPTGRRRYEIIWVVREDEASEYRRDIGPVTDVDQINIPSHMEHTVLELREMAQKLKLQPVDKLDLAGLDKIHEDGERELQ